RQDAPLAAGGGERDQGDLRGPARPGLERGERPRREAAARVAEADPADRAGAAMRRRLGLLACTAVVALALPALAFAHDAPETKQSRWVMADWMMDTFFVFSGLAVVAFLAAWKGGWFHELDSHASIPLI